jgi:hypothetical protein
LLTAVHFLSGGRTLENGETILWSAGFLTMGGATITNRAGALFDNLTAVTVNSGGGNRFDNAGAFRKSVHAGTATWLVTFNNSGLVEIETGTLALDGAGTNTSMMEIAAGAALNLSSGGAAFSSTDVFSDRSSLRLRFGGAALRFAHELQSVASAARVSEASHVRHRRCTICPRCRRTASGIESSGHRPHRSR